MTPPAGIDREWLVRWKRPGGKVRRRLYQTEDPARDLFDRLVCGEFGDCGWGVVGVPPGTTHDTENCLSCNPPPQPEWVTISSREVAPWTVLRVETECEI